MVFVRKLVKTLGDDVIEPSKMYEDNQSANMMAEGSEMHTRTALRYHAIRGYIKDMEIILKGTEEMTADTMTKALTRKQFEKFRDELGILLSGGSDVNLSEVKARGISRRKDERKDGREMDDHRIPRGMSG
jgi:hypothetical protein